MIATLPSSNPMVLLPSSFVIRRHGRACPGHPRLPCRRAKDVDARDKPGHDDNNSQQHRHQPSTVLPLLMTVTPLAFTLASNEITLPSFHNSMVTVSPG